MRRAICICLCLLSLIAASRAGAAADRAGPAAVVEKLHAGLLSNMKEGKALGFMGRAKRLEPIVREVFDLETMTRVSTGAAWRKLADAEKVTLVEAFGAWTVANYASQFKDWGGEQFVTGTQTAPDKGNVVVNTQIQPKNQAPTALNYRLRQQPSDNGDGSWRIIDIYLDGAVSQLAMRRGEFAAVLAKGGVDELLRHLNRLIAKTTADG
jgi:phospholipid transport system substrate-binding protein